MKKASESEKVLFDALRHGYGLYSKPSKPKKDKKEDKDDLSLEVQKK